MATGTRSDTETEPDALPAPPGAARPRRMTTDPGSAIFEVRGARSPLVGRDTQLAAIEEVIARAVDFHAPQLVTVVGNQGTGKSRLVSELIKRAGKETSLRVYSGRAAEGGPRYGAIASLLRNRFAINEADAPAQAAESFSRQVAEVFGAERIAEVMHFLGSFLDLRFADSPFLSVLAENPRQHDDIACTVLRRFLERDSQAGPLVLVLDNLQWADDDTLALISELGSQLGGAPLVLIGCARPEMLMRCADWGAGASDHLRIDLRNLEPDDAAQMLEQLLARCDDVPGEIIDDAVEMTGGNPYFLEQLVRLFLANGTIDASGERWRLDPDKAAATELPITIEEAIEARIAALEGPERDLLEKGAVFGHVFWLGAVVALTRIDKALQARVQAKAGGPPPPPPPGPLDYGWTGEDDPVRRKTTQVVGEMVERDSILQLDPEDSTIAGDIELVFKHNLERDLIVRSTEAGRLARYHRGAAQWLEANLAPGRSEEQLEFLGQLYERGGDRHRAARCYLTGADKARARYANEEAVDLYTRGLGLIEDADALARMEALHNLGDVLDLTGRSEEALARFGEMLRLAWMFDQRGKGGAAHSRIGRIHRRRGDYDRAMDHLREAQALFEKASDRRGIAGALDDIGKVHWLRGAYGQALEFHRQALAIRRALGERRSIALSLANIGRVHHDSGAFKAAIAQFREALDLRRDIGDMRGVVASLCDLGGVHSEDGQHEMALELFGEAEKIAREIGDKIAQTEVLSELGACKAVVGRAAEAVTHLEEAVVLATQLGDRVALSDCSSRLAEVHLRAG
ncbi:MAG TPA: tetratricopeptide repeat protein, partial [Kofleriaceae bacterium]|nr:tetratricopeptide repeat protein [Kofleriaceae bacterium]